ALFRLHDGSLRLENLEFYLRPSRPEFTAQAVVDIVGDGQCTLKECAVTLDQPGRARLAVATLSDAGGFMRMDPPPRNQNPRLRLERSFVRGEGDLVVIRGSRAFDFETEQALIVLSGSFLNVDGAVKDTSPAPTVQVRMSHVTA